MNIAYLIKNTCTYGKGIFAEQNISKGTLIWTYKRDINVREYDYVQSCRHLESLPSLADQQLFLDITFGKDEVLCLILDDGKYMNHAEGNMSNCITDLITGNCFAKRNIMQGEQLFEDYSTFSHPDFLYELLQKYKCEPEYYRLPVM